MATKNWNILSLLAVLQVLLVLAQAADIPAGNITNSIEDYYRGNQRTFDSILVSLNQRITDLRTNYNNMLNSLSYNKQLIEDQLLDNDQNLYALSFLDDQRKYCVQKFSAQVVTVASVRTTYTNCLAVANNALPGIVSAPSTTYTNLYNWYNQNYMPGITNCIKQNPAYQNQTICIANFVTVYINNFNVNERTFNTQMDAARCAFDSQVRITNECVFSAINSATSSIATVNRLVSDCVAGVGLCPACPTIPQCSNTVAVTASSLTFTNDTVANPFKGLSSSSDCVLVNFKK